MRIVIAHSGPPRLEDPCDFTRFSILMDGGFRSAPGAALRGIGRLSCDGHAWVRPDCLRALLPVDLPADWEAGFARMTEFARSRGWIGEGGAIRAHIEFRERPEAVSNDAFRNAMRKFASGVCVVAVERRKVRASFKLNDIFDTEFETAHSLTQACSRVVAARGDEVSIRSRIVSQEN